MLGFKSKRIAIKFFFFADSVVFRCKKGVDPGLKIHPSLFGAFKNEVAEHQLIKIFVTMGSKNYSYDLIDSVTNEVVGRITKIRGLTLHGTGSIAINTDAMLEFVQKIQEDKRVDKEVPQ